MTFEENPYIQKLIAQGYTFVPMKPEEIMIAANAIHESTQRDQAFVARARTLGINLGADAEESLRARRSLSTRMGNIAIRAQRPRTLPVCRPT